MRTSRFYPFGLATAILGLSSYCYVEYVARSGFWDGYVSELDRAEKALASGFIAISGLMALWFIFVGVTSFRNTRMKLFYGSGFYMIIVIVSFGLDLYLRSHLADSAGG